MRVMTWNLLWRFGEDWRARGQGIASTLEDVRPDLAGLQEVWATAETDQAAQLAGRLGMHAAFAAPSLPPPPVPPASADQAGVEVGVAVLSRWPILEVHRHRLRSRRRPEIVALEVVADHPQGPLRLLTTCIDWEREDAAQRLVQTRALTEVAVDAWVAAGAAGAGHTLSAANPLAPRAAWWLLDQRIDYVLARPGTPAHRVVVERAFLAGEPRDGRHPSDHYAVVADLRLPRG
jgi:endonuclease/exonuclease/phosphatase family metal-dependent hydrolase